MMFKRVITGYITSCIIIILYMENVLSQPHCLDRTIYSEVGSNARFSTTLNSYYGRLSSLDFRHETTNVNLITINVLKPIDDGSYYQSRNLNISFYNNSAAIKKRFTVYMYLSEYVSVTMTDVSDTDYGTYSLLHYGRKITCWNLYVLKNLSTPQITSYPGSLESGMTEEGSSVLFSGTQVYSNSLPPGLTVTMSWLVDGRNYSSGVAYLAANNTHNLHIMQMDRRLNGKNITYRATEESGIFTEANLTLRISYGPEPYLTLTPDVPMLILKEGDEFPMIYCNVECSPKCNIEWMSKELDYTTTKKELHLGKVTAAMSGEYTCLAIRDGTFKTAKRSIYLEVKGKEANVPVIILAIAIAITSIGLVALAIYVYHRQHSNVIPGKTQMVSNVGSDFRGKTSNQPQQMNSNADSTDTYIELQTESREAPVESVYAPLRTGAQPLEDDHYANVDIARTSHLSSQ